jgi:hypothetical protein
MFAVKKYSDALDQLVKERNINTKFKHTLVQVRFETSKQVNQWRGDKNEAVFQDAEGKEVTLKYDFLHVTPPMGPPESLKKSPLASSNGFVDVDMKTLQVPIHVLNNKSSTKSTPTYFP